MVNAISILLLGILFVSSIASATTTARFNRDTIRQNETVELIIESDQPSIKEGAELDVLEKDFRIISRRRDTNVTVINGKSQLVHRWRAQLSPLSVGSFGVGPIKVDSEESNRLRLTVLPEAEQPDGGEEVFIELEIDKESVYVQQQILLTANLFISVRLIDGSLADPNPANAIVRRLGKDVRYEAMRGGRSYSVYQRNFAVIPQQSGELLIPALQFEGLVDDPGSSSSGIFNPLFSQGRRISASTKATKVKVKPPAADFRGKTWLPSDQVTIKEELTNDIELVVGQPITRKIRLTGVNVTAEQLPEPEIEEVAGIKSYPDQSRLVTEDSKTGVVGSLSIDIAMIGSTPGEVTLPEISVPWWNTVTDQMETAVLPSRVVRVLGGALDDDKTVQNNLVEENNVAQSEQTVIAEFAESGDRSLAEPQIWKWLAMLMAGLWFVTLGLLIWFYRNPERQSQAKEPERRTPDLAVYYERIQEACRKDDPVAARSTLLDWGRNRFGKPVSLQQIGELVEAKEEKAIAFQEELELLDKVLFSTSSTSGWRGGEMWRLFEFVSAESVSGREQASTKLPPLYPLASLAK